MAAHTALNSAGNIRKLQRPGTATFTWHCEYLNHHIGSSSSSSSSFTPQCTCVHMPDTMRIANGPDHASRPSCNPCASPISRYMLPRERASRAVQPSHGGPAVRQLRVRVSGACAALELQGHCHVARVGTNGRRHRLEGLLSTSSSSSSNNTVQVGQQEVPAARTRLAAQCTVMAIVEHGRTD